MADVNVNVLVKAVDQASSTIRGVGKAFGDLEGQSKSITSKLDQMGQGFTKAGRQMSLFVTTPLIAAGAASIKAAADFEQTQIAFTTMLGSAKKAGDLLKELTTFATKTPFTLQGIEQSAKQLLAMGIETDKLLPTLKALGDVSAGLSIDLDRVAYNFGQVKAQGRLTGVELKDFARAGVPIIAELAKNLKTTEANIKDMVSAGEVGFADVEKAFITMTSEGGKFNNLMQEQSKTTAGQFSNLRDEMQLLMRDLGTIMLPIAMDVIQGLKGIVAAIGSLSTEQQKWLLIIAGAAAIIGPFLIVLGLLFSSLATIITAVTALGTLFAGIGLVITGPLLIAFALLGTLIFLLITQWDNLKLQVTAAAEIMSTFVSDKFNVMKQNLTSISQIISNTVSMHFDTMKSRLSQNSESLRQIVVNNFEIMKIQATSKMRDMQSNAQSISEIISNTVSANFIFLKNNINATLTQLKGIVSSALNAVWSTIAGWRDRVVGAFNAVASAIQNVISKFRDALSMGAVSSGGGRSFQKAGLVTGVRGQPQVATVHAGERIEPAVAGAGSSSGAGIVINFEGVFLGTQTEMRQFALEIWKNIGSMAAAQNKSPEELLLFSSTT